MSSASVLIRTCNGGARLRRVVEAVRGQRILPAELVLLDSGSTDGVPESLAAHARLERLPVPFSHPGSSNHAARLARGTVLVFLSQDAVPMGAEWLSRLLGPLEQPSVAASFSRQFAPVHAPVLEARDLARAYPRSGSAQAVLSNVASALRKSLWEEHPFREDLPLAEDLEWGEWARARGEEVRYVPESVVEHWHGDAPADVQQRYRLEGRALAFLGRAPFSTASGAHQAWLRGLPGDLLAVLRRGRFSELPRAWNYHRLQFLALQQGAAGVGP